MSRGIIRREKAASEGLATVRYKRCGLRFELLIHRDRIPSTGGKDLSSIYSKLTDEEILELCSAQVVFSNAHKKTPSKESERAKAFESKSENFTEMARVILSQGELQKGQEDREEISKLEHASWEVFCRTVSSRSIFPPSTNKHDKTKNSSEQNRSCHLDPSEVASSLKQLRFLRTDPNAVLDSDVIRAISTLRSSGEHPRLTRSMLRIQCCGGTSIMDALASIVAKHENYAITEPEGNESSADRSSQTTSSTWLILDASKQRSIAENLCSAHIFESVKDAEKKMMPHYPETNGIAADLTLINQSNVPVAKATESLPEDHGNNPAQRTKSKKKGTLSGNEKETKGDETWSHESKKKVNSLESELANLNLKFETVEAEDDDMTQTDRGRKKKGQKK